MGLENAVAIEELDDIAEDLADKLGVYGEERSFWVSEFKRRIRNAVDIAENIITKPSGGRICRACVALYNLRRRLERRALTPAKRQEEERES